MYKMYKISGEVIKFNENIMENWRVEVKVGGKSLAEVKIWRGIFQGDALSLLLFVIVRIPFSHISRKYASGYKLTKLQKKLNQLMHMDDIKLFTKNEE